MLGFLRDRAYLFVIIAVALLLQTSLVSGLGALAFADIPLGMMRVYFHELGHGLASLLSGGHFSQIELAFGQGGLAHTDEAMFGSKVVLFCGYLSPSLWGLLIYTAFTRWCAEEPYRAPNIFMGISVASIAIWARDIRTVGIIMFIAAVFQGIGRLESERQMVWAVKFVAVYLILGGGLDPYLFHTYPELATPEALLIWDGRALADMSHHQEWFWVQWWMAASGVSMAALLVMEWLDWEQTLG